MFLQLFVISVTNLPTRKIGSVADIDPVNEYYGSLTPAANNNNMPHLQPPPPMNTGVTIICHTFFCNFFSKNFLCVDEKNLFNIVNDGLIDGIFFIARIPSNLRLRSSRPRRSEFQLWRFDCQLHSHRGWMDDWYGTAYRPSRYAASQLRQTGSDIETFVWTCLPCRHHPLLNWRPLGGQSQKKYSTSSLNKRIKYKKNRYRLFGQKTIILLVE